VIVTLAFFALLALLGPRFVARLVGWRGNIVHRASPIAFPLAFLLALTGLAAFLGVSPIFGAMLAGILAGDLHGDAEHARQAIQGLLT
jgi:Kef-type K+ transport system membrane component KefB